MQLFFHAPWGQTSRWVSGSHPSYQTLADELGICVNTVKAAIEELEQAGLIIVMRHPRRVNQYQILNPTVSNSAYEVFRKKDKDNPIPEDNSDYRDSEKNTAAEKGQDFFEGGEKKKPELVDDAFSAGLIHDCGKLILDKYIAERKELFEQFMQTQQKSFTVAEHEVLGFDHAQIASEVCEKWQIPKNITRAIACHHNPSSAGNDDLAFIIHAADSIALMSGIGAGIDGMMYEIDKKVLAALALGADEVSLFMAEAVEFVEKTSGAF